MWCRRRLSCAGKRVPCHMAPFLAARQSIRPGPRQFNGRVLLGGVCILLLIAGCSDASVVRAEGATTSTVADRTVPSFSDRGRRYPLTPGQLADGAVPLPGNGGVGAGYVVDDQLVGASEDGAQVVVAPLSGNGVSVGYPLPAPWKAFRGWIRDGRPVAVAYDGNCLESEEPGSDRDCRDGPYRLFVGTGSDAKMEWVDHGLLSYDGFMETPTKDGILLFESDTSAVYDYSIETRKFREIPMDKGTYPRVACGDSEHDPTIYTFSAQGEDDSGSGALVDLAKDPPVITPNPGVVIGCLGNDIALADLEAHVASRYDKAQAKVINHGSCPESIGGHDHTYIYLAYSATGVAFIDAGDDGEGVWQVDGRTVTLPKVDYYPASGDTRYPISVTADGQLRVAVIHGQVATVAS